MKNKSSSMLIFAVLLLLCCSFVRAQEPQTRDIGANIQQLQGINAKWANGVALGYWPTAAATGLTLNLGSGTALNTTPAHVYYAGGTLTMTNSATNYVYLNSASSFVPASNTSGFTCGNPPVAEVVTSGGNITTIADMRGAPGGCSGAQIAVNGTTVTSTPVNFNDTTPAAAANGLNIKWQFSGAHVSGYVPGDGNASHALCGDGAFGTTCAGSGGSVNVTKGLTFSIGDPASSTVLTAASTTTDYLTIPFGCTIQAYNLITDAGTVTVKFWKIATGTALPTSSNSISTSGVGISSGTAIHSTTVSDFTTTTVTQNDIMAMNVTAASSSHYVTGTLQCSATTTTNGIAFTIGDPAGSTLTTGSTTTSYVTVPLGCTIQAYNLVVDAGTITVKFWKVATGTAIPTSSNSISTSGVGISSGTAIHSTTLSDFTTTTVTQNDIMAMTVTAVSTAKYVNGVLQCQ